MCHDPHVGTATGDEGWPKLILVAPVLAALLLFHFIAVGLFVCPPNLVSVQARPWVHAYVVPYFSQSWELFAPEPANRNDVLHVRCHLREDGTDRVTDWIDVKAPWIEARERNRFGVSSRMLRAQQSRLAASRQFERKIIAQLDVAHAPPATEILDAEAEAVFEQGKEHTQRIASAACKRRFAAETTTITEVEARLVTVPVVEYGKRDDGHARQGTAMALPPMRYVEVSL